MTTPEEYQEMLEGGCPWCGASLELKKGRYGEFIACADWCGYISSIPGRSYYYFSKKPKPTCPYKKCDGSGLLPFIKPDGTTSQYAKLFCECREQMHEYLPAIQPSDIDFSCSYDWRSYFEEKITGRPLESLEQASTLVAAPLEQVIVHRHSDMSKEDYDLLQQTARRVDYLQKKLTEKTKKKDKGYRHYTVDKPD